MNRYRVDALGHGNAIGIANEASATAPESEPPNVISKPALARTHYSARMFRPLNTTDTIPELQGD